MAAGVLLILAWKNPGEPGLDACALKLPCQRRKRAAAAPDMAAVPPPGVTVACGAVGVAGPGGSGEKFTAGAEAKPWPSR